VRLRAHDGSVPGAPPLLFWVKTSTEASGVARLSFALALPFGALTAAASSGTPEATPGLGQMYRYPPDSGEVANRGV
jgi:hypothetical protein